MPLRRVSGGWRFSSGGKLYKGRGARSRALRQARAIEASKARARDKKRWRR